MEKKYFKCYFCKTDNSLFVQKTEKGKECRCCQAYNYFFNNSKKKRNNYKNYHNNNNYNITASNYNYNNHNRNYYKKKYKRNKKNNQIGHMNNNTNIRNNLTLSSNSEYFPRINNNSNNQFHFNINNNFNNNNNIPNIIMPIPNIIFQPILLNLNTAFNNNNIFYNNHRNNLTQNNSIINNNPYNIGNRFNDFRFNRINFLENNIEKKEEDKNTIKYSWLKKEKLTIEIMNKQKEENKCSICLENIQLNNDINILKCGHIFHYKCIENLVDHHINRCPNCRSDLKTGEKQSNNQNILFNNDLNNLLYGDEYFSDLDYSSLQISDDDNEDSNDDDYLFI